MEGQQVRVWSSAGPCLVTRLIKRNRTTATVTLGQSTIARRVRLTAVHTEPCTSCPDHRASMYPLGYLD